jgi:hypothetical protein
MFYRFLSNDNFEEINYQSYGYDGKHFNTLLDIDIKYDELINKKQLYKELVSAIPDSLDGFIEYLIQSGIKVDFIKETEVIF